MIRVVVADDHPVFLAGLRTVLDAEDDVIVVEVATGGRTAVDAVAAHHPDVAVLDIAMPDGDGLWAATAIRTSDATTRVLVLTMSDDEESVFAALRAGAHGYLLKGAGPDEIVSAVRAVARGEALFGAGIAGRMLAHFSRAARNAPFPQLTEREHEVLGLLAQGLDNAAVARRLAMSAKTVRNHVSTIITKLQVADRTAAVLRARDAGLGAPPARG